MASLRMVHNDVNDRSILLHCLSPFIRVKRRDMAGEKCSSDWNQIVTKQKQEINNIEMILRLSQTDKILYRVESKSKKTF